MTDKNRNFRSAYYDKVGFRGVEEKKSLEILINEKPMDKAKLSKFCLRFTLPSIYREYVWKILLDVISVNAATHDSIMKIREVHYMDLKHSLEIMRKINEDTPMSVVHTLMFLMTKDILLFNEKEQMESLYVQNLIALAAVFHELTSSDVVAYFLFRNFVLYQRKFSINTKSLREQLEAVLRKEDTTLYEHLKFIKAFEIIPVDLWFGRYFAQVLHKSSLARICDKVIGGSCKILSYVGAAILMVRRHPLLALTVPEAAIEVLKKIPEDTSDVVVNKALDLYYS